MSGAEVAFGRR